jgi:hypothetical protein
LGSILTAYTTYNGSLLVVVLYMYVSNDFKVFDTSIAKFKDDLLVTVIARFVESIELDSKIDTNKISNDRVFIYYIP